MPGARHAAGQNDGVEIGGMTLRQQRVGGDGQLMGAGDLPAVQSGGGDVEIETAQHVDGDDGFTFFETVGQND